MRWAAMILGLIGTAIVGLITAANLGAFGSYFALGAAEPGGTVWVKSAAATGVAAVAVALVGSILARWRPRPASLMLAVAALLGAPTGFIFWVPVLPAAWLAFIAARGQAREVGPSGRTAFRVSALGLGALGAAAGVGSALLELRVFGAVYSQAGGTTAHALDPLFHDALVVGALAVAVLGAVAAVLVLWRPRLSAAFLTTIAFVGFLPASGRLYFWETNRWHLPATLLLFAALFAWLGREPKQELTVPDRAPLPAVPQSG